MSLFRENEQQATSALLTAIYDAALDPAKWQTFVDLLQSEIPDTAPLFYLGDTRTAMMDALVLSEAWGTDFLGPFLDHYNALNPWTAGLARENTIGQSFYGTDIISDGNLRKTEFFNDFFKQYWKWSSVVAVTNFRDPNAFSVLALHCTGSRLERDDKALRHILDRLSPHIARAIEISRELQHGRAGSTSMELMLETLSSPALVVNAGLRVRYANSAADMMFRRGVLTLDSQGRISVAGRGQETKAIQAALVAALAPVDAPQVPSVIRLTRPAGDEDGESMPLLARVVPFGGLERDVDIAVPVPQLPPKPEALVLMTDPAAKLPLRPRPLQQLFGLTPTEVRLAQALARGISLKGYADAAGIAKGTARVQLKSVFSKTSTHRQAELVSLLAGLADPFTLGD
ncbi:MAG: hypothetical protein R3D30_08615 [Hyphomicrobiales bacterium]